MGLAGCVIAYFIIYKAAYDRMRRVNCISERMRRRLLVIAPQVVQRRVLQEERFRSALCATWLWYVQVNEQLFPYHTHMLAMGLLAGYTGRNAGVLTACLLLGFSVHAPSMLECRVWTGAVFYTCCPHLSLLTRIAACTFGFVNPLFPPRRSRTKFSCHIKTVGRLLQRVCPAADHAQVALLASQMRRKLQLM